MKCACGAEIPEGAKFCGKCGRQTPEKPKTVCLRCGADLTPGVKFCAKCGAAVAGTVAKASPAFCRRCGAALYPGARFCGKCRTPVTEDASVPVADTAAAPSKAADAVMNKAEPKTRSKPKPNKIILIAAAVGVVVLGVVLILIVGNNGKKSDVQSQPSAQEVIAVATPEPVIKPEAEVRAHFEEWGQVKQTVAGKNVNLQIGKDALADLKNRGFDQFEVTTSYDAEGHWSADIEITSEENKKHPLYETLFVPDEETLWVIYDYNGTLMAKPLLHPSLPDGDVPIYLSETGTLMCYDAYNNMFYEMIPSPETAKVFQVSKIDSDTLIHWVYTEDNAQ